MFCPSCGANNSIGQKFCRSCGLNLEKSAESLLEQIPAAEVPHFLKYEKTLEKFGTIAFGGFVLILLAAISAIIYLIFTRMILSGQNIFSGILIISFVVFAALTLAYVVLRDELNEHKQKIKTPVSEDLLLKPNTAKLLEEREFIPASTVTENSTELLYMENKTRKLK